VAGPRAPLAASRVPTPDLRGAGRRVAAAGGERWTTGAALLPALAVLAALAPAAAAQGGPLAPTPSSDEVVHLVDEGLASEDAAVAERAAERILEIGAAAQRRLEWAIVRKHPLRRQRAAEVLGRLGEPSAVGALSAVLGDTRGDEGLKLSIAAALLELGSKEGITPLIELLESGDARMRLEAFLLLSRYTHHAFNFEYDGPLSERTRARREFRAWWQGARADFKLVEPLSMPRPRRDAPPPPPEPPTATARPEGT
jgi:HEAT repeat protein